MKNLKRTIAIVCGGDSSEHDVSLRSAQGLYSFFDKERYNVYIVDIKGQDWHVELPDGTTAKIDRNDFSFMENGEAKVFDYAYITIHGTPGENGLLQGYFDLIGLPYSTSGVLVEAMTFDKFVLNQYLRGYGVKVAVIPNWCTNGTAGAKPPQDNSYLSKIIYPAFFGGKKNQRLLIKAFEKISRDFPEWTVELYGNGKVPKKLPERVIAKGFCDLREAYSECAFVAFPSLDEGFPMTLTEAAMFGKTFLAVKDWIGVGDGRGCLLADNTASSYAKGLRRLMSDPGLCSELGRNAREICLSEYSKEKVLDMWLNLLTDARSADNRCEVRQ